ncbi:hypothetical protein EHW99_1792 [Erwinia amylovora]|uniref:Uncharacterized protein n=3 Tax=Erwinia amylovora TaxID=552 RepID=A0A831A3M3_ERWAM|nr:hypothetical protein EaACW_1799 [Erwinia amylovora ACW56400]QJQ54496.1 hypothetical protein EHX00_1792 [Erwinia amylovora]CBA20742.1 hypothetical protein predicted by Glimmer/Critica [Erwinia amylovora CFBP1430]CBX80664.1 hypothetical protein predicted by Glimmer/Critica [Erwinia amylovora ATCC BAA-2158]CCO78646.1 hypothetical protein BN432_1848 [Erwinia amylovora Ea356]CCO82442.1 hypothetical protein BN433_1872 [Erwinia amylovora Ea266]CCO86226.1 hypothetical protein BN434_1838 [Erwinia a
MKKHIIWSGKRCCYFVSAGNSSSPMDVPDELADIKSNWRHVVPP